MKNPALIVFLCALVFAPAHAGTIGVDPTSGGVAYGGGVTIGWEFEVTAAEGITVDGLAFHSVKLFRWVYGILRPPRCCAAPSSPPVPA